MRLAEEGFPDAGPSPLSWGIPNRLQRLRRPMGIIPLSRGIQLLDAGERVRARIIPALAGNTSRTRGAPRPARDHPRSRGEYSAAVTGAIGSSGSSPLSRGIRVCDDSSFPAGGIIPALAGNTTGWRELTATDRDHPRSRGEYKALWWAVLRAYGSSPLSRGIPCHVITAVAANGIIPALAGNTRYEVHDPRGQGDHPRSRGEYAVRSPHGRTASGSSPLSRGILRVRDLQLTAERIIPALAGNTSPTK